MNFSSLIETLITILIIAILYYSIPYRAQNGVLLLASYGFIYLLDWRFAVIQLIVTIFHYAHGKWLSKYRIRYLLVLGITVNVLLLLFFRSAEYFIPQLTVLLSSWGIRINPGTIEVMAPIGLSYYTLQNISYLVDIYRQQTAPVSNFVNFALYLSYFPKLLAGPIEYARTFIPKLEKSKIISNEGLAKSIVLIMVGMVRKFVIADPLSASMPIEIFSDPAYFPPFDLLGWLIVYAFVIYNDFAGYTAIARGVSSLFGIELSENFNYPYFARSFSEFWNRWHITLSHWLRDYIYFPVNRFLSRSTSRHNNVFYLAAPPMLTMLVSGLWHGLNWHMLFWGGLHGLYLLIERLVSFGKPAIHPDQKPVWWQLLSNITVVVLIIFAWTPFRMEMPLVMEYWLSLFNASKLIYFSTRLLLILFYISFWVFIDWQIYRSKDEFIYMKFPKWAQALLFAGALLLIIIALAGRSQPSFIYQGF